MEIPGPLQLLTHEALFDAFWIGEHCVDCSFRSKCPDPIEGGSG